MKAGHVFTLVVFAVVAAGIWNRGAGQEPPEGLDRFPPVPTPSFVPLDPPVGQRALALRVLDPEGAPVEDAAVHFRWAEIPHWGFTDPQGRARFEGLVESEAPDAEIHALVPGFLPLTVRGTPGERELLLRLEEPPPRPERLPVIAREDLQGAVRPLFSDDPGAFEVLLLPRDPAHWIQGAMPRRAASSPTGAFLVRDFAEGAYRAVVVPSWAAGGDWPDVLQPEASPYEHRVGAGLLFLPLAYGAVLGRVVDPEGRPLSGALVTVVSVEQPSRVWPALVTDEDGRFRQSGLPPGRYAVEARAGEGVVGNEVEVSVGVEAEAGLDALEPRVR